MFARPRPLNLSTARNSALAILSALVLSGLAAPADASLLRCQTLSETGAHESAIRICGTVIASGQTRDGPKALALFFRANSRHSSGRDADALRDIDASIDLNASDGRAFALRGSIRLRQSDARAAVEDFDRAVSLGYTAAHVYRQRADARFALGSPADAREDLEAVLQSNPRDAVALTQLALALDAAGEPASALQRADEALRFNPGYAPAQGVRAALLSARGDDAGALDAFLAASGAAPESTEYLVGASMLLVRAGRIDEALDRLNTVLDADPANAPARTLRADLYEERGLWGLALTDLERLGDGNADRSARMARLALRLGRFEEANALYQDALDVGNDADLLFEQAQALMRLERLDDAVRGYSAALELDPSLADRGILLLRGKAHFASGSTEAALNDFEKESARTPNRPRPLIWRVRLLSELGDLKQAEAVARELLKIEPDKARAHAILGDVLLKAGDIAAGRTAHEEALKRDAGFSVSRERLKSLDESNQPG